MRYKTITFLAAMLLIPGTVMLTGLNARAAEPGTVNVGDLENELTAIEKELTDLEKEIDTLLEDLVDPKLTSLAVFFESQSIRGQVPLSLQIQLDGKLLTTREFGETDRLVLIRGGAIEVYSGIAEPVAHNISVECILSSGQPEGGVISSGKSTFRFEAVRARSNFLEIGLSSDPTSKTPVYKLSARHWSREP